MSVTCTALVSSDVRRLAQLHQASFPGFFLSKLGYAFLVQFYRGFIDEETAVAIVARAPDGVLVGAAVGTTDPSAFYNRLLRKRWLGFLLASAKTLVKNPKAAPRLLRAARYGGNLPSPARGALLSSICVDPSAQSGGVGGQLLDSWTREVARRGISAAFLTTDAYGNEAVNHFYQARGWVQSERYVTREGRSMNRYTIALSGA